jgi:callose synthase
MIFTRGVPQTIDMNQEGYFEEALKMRNCLQEFTREEGPTTILGLRAHFTRSVSSLANYMALQEISFILHWDSLSLTRPLHMRLCRHPDVFDSSSLSLEVESARHSSRNQLIRRRHFAMCLLRGGSVGFKNCIAGGGNERCCMKSDLQIEAGCRQRHSQTEFSRATSADVQSS